VESDRILWEAELRDMVDIYEPVLLDGGSKQPRTFAPHERRRRRERFSLKGTAELVDKDAPNFKGKVTLKNMSEVGCLALTKNIMPVGTDVKVTLHVDDQTLTLKGQVRPVEPHVGLGI
jgi:hypothetical protein